MSDWREHKWIDGSPSEWVYIGDSPSYVMLIFVTKIDDHIYRWFMFDKDRSFCCGQRQTLEKAQKKALELMRNGVEN